MSIPSHGVLRMEDRVIYMCANKGHMPYVIFLGYLREEIEYDPKEALMHHSSSFIVQPQDLPSHHRTFISFKNYGWT